MRARDALWPNANYGRASSVVVIRTEHTEDDNSGRVCVHDIRVRGVGTLFS